MNSLRRCLLTVAVWGCGVAAAPPVPAATVVLSNGDALRGTVVSQNEAGVVFDHEALGRLTISRAAIGEVRMDVPVSPPRAAAEPPWSGEVSAGWTLRRGNTQNDQLSGGFALKRKTARGEFDVTANAYYASASRKMNAQQYDAMARYAFSFGRDRAWYHFSKLEGAHDRFANVDWRVVPSTGVGYWFADRPRAKLMAEVGVGFEHTEFRAGTASEDEIVVIPRGFGQVTLFGQTTLSQDLAVFPSLSDPGEYRLSAKTVLDHPLTAGLTLRVTFLDEFDTDPAAGAGENDARVLSSLVYSF